MKKCKFSIITFTALIFGSFIPVLQILILTANGALIGLFTSSDNGILLMNGFASLLMAVLFYFAMTPIAKFFSIIGVVLFFLPLLFYAIEKIINVSNYYFLPFLAVGVATGMLLITIELLRTKTWIDNKQSVNG
ncbi:MAG: hypothetical protein V4649_04330 [Bacteroidota bacterium]